MIKSENNMISHKKIYQCYFPDRYKMLVHNGMDNNVPQQTWQNSIAGTHCS